ncbi:MAG: T9SS type A sorting domain-containing protein [Flavobacteriia bacterium]|nr:T9SS type A sorting domain-containing protein [Flavobacteriia bacterium]
MKGKKLLLGGIGATALATLVYFLNPIEKTSKYEMKKISMFEEQNANDALKWLAARYIDAETGERISPERMKELYTLHKNNKVRSSISFEELGPDNIGGRTRAILIDKNDNNKIYAGGVSGGLFFSNDRAQTWTKVDDFPGLPFISSMTQSENGTIFVATGSNDEDDAYWDGDGIYYKANGSSTWEQVPNTGTYTKITEVVCAENSNTIFFTNSTGLKKWTIGDASITSVQISSGGGCLALAISNDGSVIVAGMSSNKTFVSEDGGNTFTPVWGSIDDNKIPANAGRIEYAISKNKESSNNKYRVYASRTDGNLMGMYVSLDNGVSWSKIAGQADGTSGLDIYRDQGTYNSILSVVPNDNERLLIGGIDIWDWNQTTSNPVYGGFSQLSYWFSNPTSDEYVHADNHEMKWDNTNRLYLGNDGGIGISEDFGETFYPANRGYNVTQFYGIAMDKDGRVMGGAQDNGTLYNPHVFNSWQNFIEVSGGDGFECEISFFNPRVLFSTLYFGALSRSADFGFSFSSFTPSLPGTTWSSMTHAFHTEFVLAEYFDENSRDSVTFFPRKDYNVNDVIKVSSMSTGDTMNYVTNKKLYYDSVVNYDPSLTVNSFKITTTTNPSVQFLGELNYTFIYNTGSNDVSVGDTIQINGVAQTVATAEAYQHYYAWSPHPVNPKKLNMKDKQQVFEIPWDTIQVQDPYQSWLILHTANGTGELYASRDALRFSKEPTWIKLATGVGGNGFQNVDIEFSRDLNRCYISCGSGIYRIDGLGNMYEQDYTNQAAFRTAVQALGTAKTKITNTACEGIALNPNNDKDLLFIQMFGGSTAIVKRTANADVATPTFTTLRALDVPGYDAIIDRDNPEIIVAATAFGVMVSTNGADPGSSTSWQDASTGFENVPVFEIRQNWRTWEEGCTRPGEIYIGTYGRGMWASSSLLGLDDKNTSSDVKKLKTNLKVYPNPATDVTKLNFSLYKNSDVMIEVYSISGRLIHTSKYKQLSKGDHQLSIDTDSFSNGSYIVKFTAGDVNETVKFLKF